MQTASLIVYVYAVLVIIGGVIGYTRAGSRPSLIMGSVSGLILLLAGWGLRQGAAWGKPLAVILTFLLLLFFGTRYLRGAPRAFMPGGLMAILSLAALVAVLATARGH